MVSAVTERVNRVNPVDRDQPPPPAVREVTATASPWFAEIDLGYAARRCGARFVVGLRLQRWRRRGDLSAGPGVNLDLELSSSMTLDGWHPSVLETKIRRSAVRLLLQPRRRQAPHCAALRRRARGDRHHPGRDLEYNRNTSTDQPIVADERRGFGSRFTGSRACLLLHSVVNRLSRCFEHDDHLNLTDWRPATRRFARPSSASSSRGDRFGFEPSSRRGSPAAYASSSPSATTVHYADARRSACVTAVGVVLHRPLQPL